MGKVTKAELLNEVATLKKELEEADISACTARATARQVVSEIGAGIASVDAFLNVAEDAMSSAKEALETIRGRYKDAALALEPPSRRGAEKSTFISCASGSTKPL